METSIVLAVLSMGFAGLNDMVFKFYSSLDRSRGIYVSIIGAVILAVFIIPANFAQMPPGSLNETLLWGCIGGGFSVSANIILIEAMAKLEAGICSTIYRLNLATATLFAFIFLGEPLSFIKILGVFCAIAAVLLFTPKHAFASKSQIKTTASLAIAMVVLANILRAGMGISYKYALSVGAEQQGILALTGAWWIFGGIVYALLRERKKSIAGLRNLKTHLYGVLSGLLICGIIFFMAAALKNGEASIVLPISQMSFIITAILGVFVLKESLTFRKSLGIAFGILCIILMSLAR